MWRLSQGILQSSVIRDASEDAYSIDIFTLRHLRQNVYHSSIANLPHANSYPGRNDHQLCSKTFRQWSPFRRHMRSHQSEKQFKCTMCWRGFHEKTYLRNHMHVHTNERPNLCPICKKGYSKRCHVRKHLASFHKVGDVNALMPRKELRSNNRIFIPPD